MEPVQAQRGLSARREQPAADPLGRRWPWLARLFVAYARRLVARNFHALRLAPERAWPALPPGPVVVALNHASWWDPLVAMALSHRLPGRIHCAPIEGAALARYRFFERLGFFGVDRSRPGALARFLAVAEPLLARTDVALWITPQGRFEDPRQRPLRLERGVGHLAQRLRQGVVLPLAIEYPFWDERRPEALALFGEPLLVPDGATASPDDWTQQIAARLEAAQQELAARALTRDAGRFDTLLAGRVGVGGVYDLWRRAMAALRGERFDPEHRGLRPPRAAEQERPE